MTSIGEKYGGVNLGGWLVLERWLTPSVFAGTDAPDEFSFMKTKNAAAKIRTHRETFITEDDWRWLKEHGVTFVRLPVGYWVLNDDGPFVNAAKYLDWAFKMGEKYNIRILLDLHALKGSQNGEMHSGRVGKIDWWRYRYETLETIRALAKRYKNSSALWGIQIINEPKVLGHYFQLLWYYRRAYAALREELLPGTRTVFHDGFVGPLLSGAIWQRKGYPVILDSHFYLTLERISHRRSPEKYDAMRAMLYGASIRLSSLAQPVIVGEWGSVLPQKMLNRYPQKEHLNMLAETMKRQRKIYSHAEETAFWNYKAEGRGMYNFQSLVEDGVL